MNKLKQLFTSVQQFVQRVQAWITHLISEDNSTGLDADVLKILALLAVLNISAYAWYGLIVRDHFVVLDYGKALAIVLGAAGTAIGVKNWTTK